MFDTESSRTISCKEWLGQQVVNFDSRTILLKEIIQTVVKLEGAHATNVARLGEIEGHKPSRQARNLHFHLLNNFTLFGIRYAHLIVIEASLYLYEILLDEPSIGDYILD